MARPRILFFNINGSGMGHMSRCLAYARRLRERADIAFFSLASAIEIIEEMGFRADYFVSHFWSSNSAIEWNCELSVRLGMMLEEFRPDVVVFDGTWPYQGFMAACGAYGGLGRVWSNRGLLKEGSRAVPVDESLFDLVIQPGELGTVFNESVQAGGGKKITVPPVALLDDDELMDRASAREALGLEPHGRYALFSLGPGNLKDVGGIGWSLIRRFEALGFRGVWARAPISVRDVELPEEVRAISVYPLVRYLRAFDAFVGAAGYNTCIEVVQARVPGLLIPNTLLADDQARRAGMVAENAPVVVASCETEEDRRMAIARLLELLDAPLCAESPVAMPGASLAAEEILALANRRGNGWG
ncbi:MAG: glycosyl transferase [Candidatus Accumulibacter sp.]|nr:glycosyl transferase [Accumulibacter sp.]